MRGATFETQATLAVRGGTVVNSDWTGAATVLVVNGRISALLDPADPIPSSVERIVDASDQLVLPGGVDPHCHVDTTIGDFTSRDDYAAASKAALFGGTTTIVDFAIPLPGQSPLDAVLERREAAGQSRCATALHGCVVDWDDTVPDQLKQMAALGVRTVKLFTTYRGEIMAGPDTVLRVMEVLSDIGGLAYVHAEADHLVRGAQAKAAALGRISAEDHGGTRPEIAEAAAVADVLATAETLGAPVYFVHQTTPQAVGLVRDARRRGVKAYTESCPHYLILDDSIYDHPHAERFVCCPPLRPVERVDVLRRLVHSADIDTIGSDHCCFDTQQKVQRADDVRAMPNGMPGVETRLPLIFSKLVVDEGLSLQKFVAITSSNPARLNGLYPRKGAIAPGADADIVVFDPGAQRRVSANDLHMATDYTPYESQVVTGWPTLVISGGSVVVENDRYFDPGPVGEKLHADALPDHLIC